jgi:hypothetical protein
MHLTILTGVARTTFSLIDSVAFPQLEKSLTTQYRGWMPSRAKDASTTIGNAFSYRNAYGNVTVTVDGKPCIS